MVHKILMLHTSGILDESKTKEAIQALHLYDGTHEKYNDSNKFSTTFNDFRYPGHQVL